jgi:hypothetical protein
MSEQSLETAVNTDNTDQTISQETLSRTYSQEEFDRHMAGLKSSLTKKIMKQFEDLGDVDELRQLKQASEQRKLEEAKKRGEWEKLLQDMAAKKDAEIAKRDDMIRQYKVDMPLLSSAAKLRAVNPEQVRSLIKDNIRLSAEGEVEVVGEDGQVRYDDSGKPVSVDTFVQEWLQRNPHFCQATPATTMTNSNVGVVANPTGAVDITRLDLTRADHRKLYAQAKAAGRLN